jgi:hypothetical protein
VRGEEDGGGQGRRREGRVRVRGGEGRIGREGREER